MKGIAKGLEYLHGKDVVHGDLTMVKKIFVSMTGNNNNLVLNRETSSSRLLMEKSPRLYPISVEPGSLKQKAIHPQLLVRYSGQGDFVLERDLHANLKK